MKNFIKSNKAFSLMTLVILIVFIIGFNKSRILYFISAYKSDVIGMLMDDKDAIRISINEAQLFPSRAFKILSNSKSNSLICSLLKKKLKDDLNREEKIFCYYFLAIKEGEFEHYKSLLNLIIEPSKGFMNNFNYARLVFSKIFLVRFKIDLYEYFEVKLNEKLTIKVDDLEKMLQIPNSKISNHEIKSLEDD